MSTPESSHNNLIFVEFPEHIKEALKFRNIFSAGNTKIVALTPHVQHYFENIGEQYVCLEDYFNSEKDKHFNIKKRKWLSKLVLCIDSFFITKLKEFDIPIPLGSICYYHFNYLINSYIIRLHALSYINVAEKPTAVYIFPSSEDTSNNNSGLEFYEYHHSIWKQIITIYFNLKNIKAVELESSTIPKYASLTQKPTNIHELKSPVYLRVLVRLERLIRRISEGIGNGLAKSAISSNRGKNLVLLLSTTYALKYVHPILKQNFEVSTLTWNSLKRKYNGVELANKCDCLSENVISIKDQNQNCFKISFEQFYENSDEIKEALSWNGIDLHHELRPRFKTFFNHVIPDIFNKYFFAREILEKHNPKIVISDSPAIDNRIIAYAARKKGIPSINIHHGAMSGILENSEHDLLTYWNEIEPYNYLLAFGSANTKYFSKIFNDYKRFVSTGSPKLDKLKQMSISLFWKKMLLRSLGLTPSKPVIVYLPTAMDGNLLRPNINRMSNRYYRIQRRLIEEFKKHPEIQFVIKLIPPNSVDFMTPALQLIYEEKIENCRVMYSGWYTHLLTIADMFIIDMPLTGFLEMCTTRQPILVLGYELPWKWAPGIVDKIRKRVEYSEDIDNFITIIRRYIRERSFGPLEPCDDIILELAGTYLNDGLSAKRMESFILEKM
ncbi:MAG: CDP-glycerol glycerophosphotransferase family protein [Candidatus Scalinduaceae bacterium]